MLGKTGADSARPMRAIVSLCTAGWFLIAPAALADDSSQTIPEAAALAPETVVVAPPQRTEVKLPNGLKLVILEDHSFPIVSCLTFYRVGSRNEMPGCTGITHVLEHLLFGTVGPFKKGEIAASLMRLGGQFNGFTSDDFTVFFETLPASRVEVALKIEAERMRHASFTENDLQEEIANVQHEFENENQDANATLNRETRAMLYLTHPYHNPPIGWRTDVDNLNVDRIRAYYDSYFRPDNCTLVISGDVRPDFARKQVEKYFAAYKAPDSPVGQVKIAEQPQRGERRVVVKYPGKQEALQVAYHAPAFDDADAPAMVVLEKLLNAALSGRLRTRLVDQKICSSAQASFEAKKDPGYFSITCIALPGTTNAQQKIGDAIDALITQLRIQPVSDAEIKRARNQAELAFYSEQEGPYRAGFYLGYFDALSQWQGAMNWADRLRSVSAADIQRVVKRYFNADNRVVAWLAGSAAPKPVAPKTSDSGSSPAKTSPPRQMEHSRLTGYKADDTGFAPGSAERWRYVIADSGDSSTAQSAEAGSSSDTAAGVSAPLSGSATVQSNPVQNAIKGLPSALPAAVKDLPAAIGGAPGAIKDLPQAVEKVPAVIKNIPSAIGGIPSVIKELPSAVGSIPSAIKELPGAIGGIPRAAATAVKALPSAIGSIPGAAVSTIKELPGTSTAIPKAAATAVKGMPGAIGSFAVQVGSVPAAIGKSLTAGSHPEAARIARRTLKNGVTLLIYQSHLSPIVQIEGAVRAGSAYDPPEKPGLASVVAALFNQGTARRGHWQLATQQEDLGLTPNQMLRFEAATGTIRFSSRCLSRDVGSQLDLIAETLAAPANADSDIEHAKQEVLSRLKLSDDTAEDKASRALLRNILMPSSPYVPEDPSVQSRSIPSVTAADVEKFINSYVLPGDTIVVMAGDVDPDRAAMLAERSFAGWNGKPTHQRLHAHPNAHRVVRATVPIRDKTRTVIGFGQLVPVSRSASEFGSLLIADAVLSNHPIASRLNRKIAETASLTQALGDQPVEARMQPLSNAVAWSMTLSVDPGVAPLVVQTVERELKQLSQEGISSDELAEAKRYLLGAIPVEGMSTVSNAALTVLETATHQQEGENLWAEMSSVRSATVDSVNHVIRNVLKPDQTTLVVVGTPLSIRSVRSQVLSHASDHDAADHQQER